MALAPAFQRTPPIPRSLSGLQAARAVAAIMVVLFHTSMSIFALPKYWHEKPFGRLFDFGDSGVFFFFVLSGFIILHAHYPDLDRPDRVRAYLSKRMRRIYPIYWVILVSSLPAYITIANYGKGYETQFDVILSSVLLIHIGSPHAVILVSWTLFHEILFYAVFSSLIWNSQVGRLVLGSWLASSIVGLATQSESLLIGFYCSGLHLLFGFGLAAAWWIRRHSMPSPLVAALAGVALYLLAGADEVYSQQIADNWRPLIFGLGATLIILAMVESERRSKLRIAGWLRLLGDASYSIYLVHFFALSLLAKIFWACGAARIIPPMIAYLLLASLAVAAGTLCHLIIERPLLALTRRKAAPVHPVRVR